ncbi:MAG: carbon-nitrogen family hydrolase [Verrucomicrobia bacterium]|nr:carbon-nitrogen family hydrolase [Verrucomicrobiota bacterium]
MRIVACQLDCAWEDKKANYAKVRSLLDAASIPAGALVVLPEMFSTGFSMNVAGIREAEPSETETFLANTARHCSAFVLGGLVTQAEDGRGRNEAVVFGPDGERLCRYGKIHPFSFGGETKHYAGGNEVVTFQWQDFVVAPFVCYDLRFPEIFRIATQRGAHLLAVIANWPTRRVNHWVALLQARAIENQAYVVGVNRVGNDPKLSYPGRSLIVDPQGEVLAEGSAEEQIVSGEVDVARVISWRNEFPALRDLRPEFVPGTKTWERFS